MIKWKASLALIMRFSVRKSGFMYIKTMLCAWIELSRVCVGTALEFRASYIPELCATTCWTLLIFIEICLFSLFLFSHQQYQIFITFSSSSFSLCCFFLHMYIGGSAHYVLMFVPVKERRVRDFPRECFHFDPHKHRDYNELPHNSRLYERRFFLVIT